ncbi:radical SAM protein [bacterium]|nr:radical SAM protein [bacterium]
MLSKKFPDTPILVFGDSTLEENNCEQILKYSTGIITSPLLFNIKELQSWTIENFVSQAEVLGLKTLSNFANKIPIKKSFKTFNVKPRHELFIHKRYRWPFATYFKYTTITTSWGCPYSCSYCTASNLSSIYRIASDVIEDMEKIKAMGIKEIYFSDKSFGLPKENTTNILNLMIEKKFKFSWSTYFHPNQYSPDFLQLMKTAGCHTIIIGIESYNRAKLRQYGRVIQDDKLEGLIKKANEIGINVCGDFIIGFPHETQSEIMETLDWSRKLDIDYASFNIATPLPNTSIKLSAIKNGLILPNAHHFDTTGLSGVMTHPQISHEKLLKMRNHALGAFYLRPSYWIKRLSRLRGFQHLVIQIEECLNILFKAISSK